MNKQLYNQEEQALKDFHKKVKKKDIYLEDVESFISEYKDLLNLIKVITRVSDRLQRKLDSANQRIHDRNVQITKVNGDLKDTVGKLAEARVGKKASTIMFTAAIILFVSEEYYLSPVVEHYIVLPYFGLAIKGMIALILKFLESGLESYYLRQEKNKIMRPASAIKEVYSKKYASAGKSHLHYGILSPDGSHTTNDGN